MSTVKLDEQGRIMLPADLIARLKMNPGDEFVIGEAKEGSILLKKKDLRAILEDVIKEARNVDLDKLKRALRTKATALHERSTRSLLETKAITKLVFGGARG